MVQDVRGCKVVLVAHCVLNQNARISGSARYPAVASGIVDVLTRHNVGMVQMPCPELLYAGLSRASRTKEEYDTPQYRKHCRQIASSMARQVQEYLQNNIQVLAILGVEESPSCGIGKISGMLIEELRSELKKRNITVPFHELKLKKIAETVVWLEKNCKKLTSAEEAT